MNTRSSFHPSIVNGSRNTVQSRTLLSPTSALLMSSPLWSRYTEGWREFINIVDASQRSNSYSKIHYRVSAKGVCGWASHKVGITLLQRPNHPIERTIGQPHAPLVVCPLEQMPREIHFRAGKVHLKSVYIGCATFPYLNIFITDGIKPFVDWMGIILAASPDMVRLTVSSVFLASWNFTLRQALLRYRFTLCTYDKIIGCMFFNHRHDCLPEKNPWTPVQKRVAFRNMKHRYVCIIFYNLILLPLNCSPVAVRVPICRMTCLPVVNTSWRLPRLISRNKTLCATLRLTLPRWTPWSWNTIQG